MVKKWQFLKVIPFICLDTLETTARFIIERLINQLYKGIEF